MRTLKELAAEAVQIQDACNGLGLTKGFAQAADDLRNALRVAALPDGTDDVQRHPIFKLWASKLHDLARMGFSDLDSYGKALDECRRIAAG